MLRFAVVRHGGLSRTATPLDPVSWAATSSVLGRAAIDVMDTLSLSIVCLPGSGTRGGDIFRFDFRGRWAVSMCALEPGDLVSVDDVHFNASAGCWQMSADSGATIFREGLRARLMPDNVRSGDLPSWLHYPPTRLVEGTYSYIRYLCTLKQGIEVNMFAVVWEVAKPGVMVTPGDRVTMNLIVVDRCFDALPCCDWSKTPDMPQFSLQTNLPGATPSAHPFLSVGDVVRVHRAKIAERKPGLVNIRMSGYSSMLVYEEADDGGRVDWRSLTSDRPTITQADYDRAEKLRTWCRQRIRRETVSGYLSRIADLLAINRTFRDLVVQVCDVDLPRRELLVSDGSTMEPVVVDASAPSLASDWLFQHVLVGQWVKLRSAKVTDGELSVSAAFVTRLPSWCFDVSERSCFRQAAGEVGAATIGHIAAARGTLVPPEQPSLSAPHGQASPVASMGVTVDRTASASEDVSRDGNATRVISSPGPIVSASREIMVDGPPAEVAAVAKGRVQSDAEGHGGEFADNAVSCDAKPDAQVLTTLGYGGATADEATVFVGGPVGAMNTDGTTTVTATAADPTRARSFGSGPQSEDRALLASTGIQLMSRNRSRSRNRLSA